MTSDDVQRCNARTRNRNAQLLRRRRREKKRRLCCFPYFVSMRSHLQPLAGLHLVLYGWDTARVGFPLNGITCRCDWIEIQLQIVEKYPPKTLPLQPQVPTFICHRRSIESNTFFLFSVTGEQKNADMIIAGTHMFRYFFRVTPHSRPRVDRRSLCPRDHAKEIQRKSRIGRNNNKLKGKKKLTASQSNQRRTNVRYARLRAHNANGQGQPARMRRMEMNRNEQ